MTRRGSWLRAGLVAAAVCGTSVPALVAAAPAQAATQCQVGSTHYIAQFSPHLLSPAFARSWRLATGKGVTVAVVDSGVDTANAHLPKSTVLPGKSFVPGGATKDDYGHGTAAAGIIAAQQLPGGRSGLIGAAPGAKILPVRVFDQAKTDQSTGPVKHPPSTKLLAEGIRWAAAHGAGVINVSMSTDSHDPNLSALEQAVAFAHAKGAVVVASGGDTSSAGTPVTQPRFPAALPDVIGVAATDAQGSVDSYSVHGSDIDVSAPGQDVLLAFHGNGDCESTQQPYTSWAAAFVSAEAALLRQRFPQESADQIAYRIEASASRPVQGQRDNRQGWGQIRPYVALTMTLDPRLSGPPLPGHHPTAPPTAAAGAVRPVGAATDPLGSVRREGLWWALGALGVSALALILKPLAGGRRR